MKNTLTTMICYLILGFFLMASVSRAQARANAAMAKSPQHSSIVTVLGAAY